MISLHIFFLCRLFWSPLSPATTGVPPWPTQPPAAPRTAAAPGSDPAPPPLQPPDGCYNRSVQSLLWSGPLFRAAPPEDPHGWADAAAAAAAAPPGRWLSAEPAVAVVVSRCAGRLAWLQDFSCGQGVEFHIYEKCPAEARPPPGFWGGGRHPAIPPHTVSGREPSSRPRSHCVLRVQNPTRRAQEAFDVPTALRSCTAVTLLPSSQAGAAAELGESFPLLPVRGGA